MTPPRVLVNLTWLVPGVVGGSEESTTDMLRAVLAEAPTDLQLHLAVLEPFAAAHPDLAAALPCQVLRLDGRDKRRRVLAEQTWLTATTRRLGAAVVHHAGGVVPLVHPGRVVVTIHDLQPLELARNFSVAKRTYIRTMAGRSVRAARIVCVPSEFTRSRVIDLLDADPERVVVVPWSVRPPLPASSGGLGSTAAVLPAGVRAPFLLYPAITYPHKNHLVLLDAFGELARTDPDVQLVLTGGAGAT
ncbi:MAG: glycosyltransferase, partial [Microthrixaceae bacterium]